MNLINNLINQGWLKTPKIIEAFKKIKRKNFLPAQILQSKTWAGEPKETQNLAELDSALPIGFGQTISQPLVVAFMLELLQPKPGDKILDIGSGSGWTTALLAYIVSSQENSKFQITNHKQIINHKSQIPNGKVIAVEIIPELMEFGKKNIAKYNFLAPYRTEGSGTGIKKGIVELICADGTKGYEKSAPYDKILCSAAAQKEIPQAWREQLKIGGRIVSSVDNSIWLFVKKSEKEFEETEYPGFVFVPLVEK